MFYVLSEMADFIRYIGVHKIVEDHIWFVKFRNPVRCLAGAFHEMGFNHVAVVWPSCFGYLRHIAKLQCLAEAALFCNWMKGDWWKCDDLLKKTHWSSKSCEVQAAFCRTKRAESLQFHFGMYRNGCTCEFILIWRCTVKFVQLTPSKTSVWTVPWNMIVTLPPFLQAQSSLHPANIRLRSPPQLTVQILHL